MNARKSESLSSKLCTRLTCAWFFWAVICTCAIARGESENAAQRLSRDTPASRDVGDEVNKALYCVGYAHLDTQWRWDYVKTIDDYIRATLDDNFALFEWHPEYVFSFTGSARYQMMKEYYPKRYQRLKQYIADKRWFVSGSSVDEGDVNVPSPESIIRQVLYGNLFFKREFGAGSVDFMLPDCFGFPASMPSIWAHCGLLGFSTQKLTWGSAVGIPFPIGVWEGPDGTGRIAGLTAQHAADGAHHAAQKTAAAGALAFVRGTLRLGRHFRAARQGRNHLLGIGRIGVLLHHVENDFDDRIGLPLVDPSGLRQLLNDLLHFVLSPSIHGPAHRGTARQLAADNTERGCVKLRSALQRNDHRAFAASRKALMRCGSFCPGADSTPEETSMPGAPETATARANCA